MKKILRYLIVSSLLVMILFVPHVYSNQQAVSFSNLTAGQNISGVFVINGRIINDGQISKVAVKMGDGPWEEAAGIEKWQYKLDSRQIFLDYHYRFDSTAGRMIRTTRYGPYYGELQITAGAFDAQDALVAEKTITINVIPEKPVIDLYSGVYSDSLYVTIKKAPEVEVYYTTDGRDPIEHGQIYHQPIFVFEDTVLKAVARSANGKNSGVEVVDLKINREAPLKLMVQYYHDQALTKPLPEPPYLKAGTYYLKVVSNQKLTGKPRLTITTPGTQNNLQEAELAALDDYTYWYTKVVKEDPAARGEVQEEITISGVDYSGFPFTLTPVNAGSKAAYLDTAPPSIGTIQLAGGELTTYDPTPLLIIKSDGAAQMRLALSEEELAKAPWVEYAGNYDGFDLSRGGKGSKTIWVEFRDQAGNIQNEHAFTNVVYDDSTLVFDIEYFADPDFAVSLGDDPYLAAGTYYLKLTANQDLSSPPLIQIDAEGNKNDLSNVEATRINARNFYYVRTIVPDAEAVGSNKEEIRLQVGSRIIFPSNLSKAAYTDTQAPATPFVSVPAETNNPRPTWSWEHIDDAFGYRYSFTDGENWVETTALSFTPDEDLAINNSYTLYVQARDKAGNWSESGSATVYIHGKPGIRITEGPNIIENAMGSYDFGSVFVSSSAQATFSITNTGTADLELTGEPLVAITGADSSDFSVISFPGRLIAAGESTAFVISFTPSGSGEKTATVSIANNVSGQNPYTFTITGKGEVELKPEIQVTHGTTVIPNGDSYSFGCINAASFAEATFTITNTGAEVLELTGGQIVSIGGDGYLFFQVMAQPEKTLISPQESTTFTVRFTPQGTEGVKTVTVSIPNNSGQNPYTFTLTGDAVADKPAIEVWQETTILPNDGSYDFGGVLLSSYVDVTFTIKNTGTAQLELKGAPRVSVFGEHRDDFSVLTQPGMYIAPGASTTFTIRFTPKAAGARTAKIRIETNVAEIGYYYTLTITGTGETQPVMGISHGSTSIPHDGSCNLEVPFLSSGEMVFTIKNSGNGTLELTGDPVVTITGPGASRFHVEAFPATVIGPKTETTFTIRYTPSGLQEEVAVISINNNAGQDPYAFTIKGRGGIEQTLGIGSPVTAYISAGQVLTYALDFASAAGIIWEDQKDGSDSTTYNSNIRVSAYREDLTPVFENVDSGYTSPQAIPAPDGGNATIYLKVTGVTAGRFRLQAKAWEAEMNVYQNETLIPHETGSYNYGKVLLFENKEMTFTIKNTGAAPLQLTASPRVEITGDDASCFTVTAQPAKSVINHGGNTTFTLRFTPDSSGSKTAIVSIACNDNNKNPYLFQVTGTGDSSKVIPLSLGFWKTDLYMSAGNVFFFSIATTPGDDYLITWDDSRNGTGAYSCDIRVSAYRKDLTTPYFTNVDHGYSTPQIITAQDDLVYLKVTGATSSTIGSFAIKAGIYKPMMRVRNGGLIRNGSGSYPFGEYSIHSKVEAKFIIKNEGGKDLTLTGTPFVIIEGEDAEHFSVVRQPYSTLPGYSKVPPGLEADFTLSFNPSTPGAKTATVIIANDDPKNNPYTFTITGTATLEPETLNLGDDKWRTGQITRNGEAKIYAFNTEPGKIYAVQWDDVKDGGSFPYPFGLDIQVTAYHKDLVTPYPELFEVDHGYSSFPTITAQEDLVYLKVFRPLQDSDEGLFAIRVFWHEAIIEVSHDGNGLPNETGSYDFGDVLIRESSTTQFTVKNTGNIDLNIGDPQITGSDANCFSVKGGDSHLDPGESTVIEITFTPDSMGEKTAVVTIPNSDFDRNPFTFTITGTCLAPLIQVKHEGNDIPNGTGIFAFGDVPAFGSRNATFTIQNPGTSPLTLLDQVRITGPNASSFTVLTQPTSPLAPGEETTFMIRFNPFSEEEGEKTATVTIKNDSGEDYYFTITGNEEGKISFTSLELDTWTTGSLSTFGELKYYVFTFSGDLGKEFLVQWDDGGQGSGAYTGDIMVKGYTIDLSSSYFAGDSAYLEPIRIEPIEYAFILRVECKSPGTFALRILESRPKIRVARDDKEIYAFNCGFVAVGHSEYFGFAVQNIGTEDLELLGNPTAELLLDADNSFRITEHPFRIISPNSSSTLVVGFSPQSVGTKSAIISIKSNDPDTYEYTFSVSGIGVDEVQPLASSDYNKWILDSIPSYSYTLVYRVPATVGKTYTIAWDDLGDGTGGSNWADIIVSAYHADGKRAYFSEIDHGYTEPQSITAEEDLIFIHIQGKYEQPHGYFQLKVGEVE